MCNSLNLCPSYSSVFGSLNLTTVKLTGVGSSFQKHTDAEPRGIKAHFNMDESGVLLLDRVSYVVTFHLIASAVTGTDYFYKEMSDQNFSVQVSFHHI